MPSLPPTKLPIIGQDKTGRAIASAKGGLKSLGAAAKSVGGMMVGALGVAGIARFAKSVIDYGSGLTDAATATNTNIEALQALRYAAQEAGATETNLQKALVQVQKTAIEASQGLTTYGRAYDALGINVESFIKLPTERKLETIGKAMTSANDKQLAYASAMQILGTRNAPALMEVLQSLGTVGFDFMAKKAKAAGQVMDEFTAKQLDEAADALERFRKKMTVTGATVLTFYMDLFEGKNPFVEQTNAAANALLNNLDPALAEIVRMEQKYQDLVATGATVFAAYYREQITEREAELAIIREQESAQKALNDSISARPEQADDSKKTALGKLIRRFSEMQAKPGAVIEILKSEVESGQKALREMTEKGLEGTDKWVEAYSEVIKKSIKLHELEKIAAREREQAETKRKKGIEDAAEKKKKDELDAIDETLRKRDKAIASLGIGGVSGTGAQVLPEKRELSPIEKMEKSMQDAKDRMSFSMRSSADPSSPLYTGPTGEGGQPAGQADGLTTAADNIKTGTERAAEIFEKVSESIAVFVQRLDTAEQQIGNLR